MYAGIQDFPQSHARHFDPRSVDQRQNHSEKEISEIAISLREVKKNYISMPTRQIVITNWEDLDCLIFSYILICTLLFFFFNMEQVPPNIQALDILEDEKSVKEKPGPCDQLCSKCISFIIPNILKSVTCTSSNSNDSVNDSFTLSSDNVAHI